MPRRRLLYRAMKAGFWAFAIRGIGRAMTITRTLILARLLAPTEFGLMGIAVVVMLLLDRLSQTGFTEALIQREGDIDEYLDSTWTIEIIRNVILAGLLLLAAPLVAMFYVAPELLPILRVLAISVVVRGFTNTGVVAFRRALEFDKQFRFELSQRITEVVVGIAAAIILRNVWALVFGVLASSVVRVVMSFVLVPQGRRLEFNRAKARDLFSFGKWVLVSGVMTYFVMNLDDLVVGKLVGVAGLGLYRMAFTISQAVATELAQVTNQVTFPAYSQVQGSLARLTSAYRQTLHAVAFLAFPAALGVFVVAQDFTAVVLGEHWLPMVRALQIMSIGGLIRSLGATAAPLLNATGNPKMAARYVALKLFVLASLIYPLAVTNGLSGAAAATAIASLVSTVGTLRRVSIVLKRSWLETVRPMLFPALHGTITALAIYGVRSMFAPESGWIPLAAMIAVGAAVYTVVVQVSARRLGYDDAVQLWASIKGLRAAS